MGQDRWKGGVGAENRITSEALCTHVFTCGTVGLCSVQMTDSEKAEGL